MNKNNTPEVKVSVIMTVLNGEEYISESLDSVLNQTLQALEVVCVDGGSTDRTLDIIQSYMDKDPRVKLYAQTRPGIGAAKNCGIEFATGDYITFLDSDDFYVDATALEKMYQACIKNNVRVCGALRSVMFSDGVIDEEPLHRKDCKGNPDGVLLHYRDKQYDYHFHSYLYLRELVMSSGARFNEVRVYDDTHYFIRIMLAAEDFYVVPVELYRYRCGPAYDWEGEKAEQAIASLTNQLQLTKTQRLARLHWTTVQRINYEYGGIFERNIRLGHYNLLRLLIAANDEVDIELIKQAERETIPEDYLETMMHRRVEDMPLRRMEEKSGHIILEPLWKLMVVENLPYSELLKEKNLLQQEIDSIRNSRSYKAVKTAARLLKGIKSGTGNRYINVADSPKESCEDKNMEKGHAPKVSIVVPVFNVKRYIEECLDSILGQTLEDIEVLCGDGGSNDGSLEILREYAKRDSRVIVVSREGSGYGQSVNECMDMARGKYIGIVESDDVVRPETYQTLFDIAEKNDLDWVRADIYFYHSGMPEGEQLQRESIIYGADFYNSVLNPQTDYRPYRTALRTWSGLYKREFLDRNGIRHNETPGGSYQDVGFYLKTLWYAKRVYFTDQAFYMWRQDNMNSSMHYNAEKLVNTSMKEWRLDREYLERHPELGARAWASFHYRQFFSYMWTIDMASEEMKDNLRKQVAGELGEALELNRLDPGFFGEHDWHRVLEFITTYGPNKTVKVPAIPRRWTIKAVIKKLFLPAANFSRKVVAKLMRNVLWQQQEEFVRILKRVNETAGDSQWQTRECAEALAAMITQGQTVAEQNAKKLDLLVSRVARLEQICEAQAEQVAETKQKVLDQGEILWTVKSRSEDIHAQVAETGQKVLDQGEVLWTVKSRQNDLMRYMCEGFDNQMIHTLTLGNADSLQQVISADPMYDIKFYWKNRYGSICSAQHVLGELLKELPHEKVVDFGCGTGTWLWVAQSLGAKEVLGLDGAYVPVALLMIPKSSFKATDLEKPVQLERKFDLAISVEVAEHLHESAADVYVESLCRSSDIILFSAAHPGQGGDGHYNEQPREYWIDKFDAHGFCCEDLRPKFAANESIEPWYRENIMLFRKKDRS